MTCFDHRRPSHLLPPGLTSLLSVDLQELMAAKVSAGKLRAAGFSWAELRVMGLAELKGLASAGELRRLRS